MSKKANPLDAFIGELAPVRDDELVGELRSRSAAALLVSIIDSPVDGPDRGRIGTHRVRVVAVVAALTLAAVLSIPAFGVGHEIVSFFAGWRDPDAPIPTASDVVIASGEAGVPWKIIATRSDQGLCLGLFYRASGDSHGSGGCGYVDIRGDLPPDIRGDPALRCIGPPTTLAPGGTLVPCGSLPRHWIGPVGASAGSEAGLDHIFAFGPLAEKVASVELILNDGRTLRAHVVERPGGLPLNVYWAAWPCPLRPAGGTYELCAEEDDVGSDLKMAIARDAAGRALERRVPPWNGNPTGDPDGPPPPAPLGE
jgi:hypothetical protein